MTDFRFTPELFEDDFVQLWLDMGCRDPVLCRLRLPRNVADTAQLRLWHIQLRKQSPDDVLNMSTYSL